MLIGILILVFVIGLIIVFAPLLEYYVLPFIRSVFWLIIYIIFTIVSKIFKARFFIIFMLLGFFSGLSFDYILPKFNHVVTISIAIFLLPLLVLLFLVIIGFNKYWEYEKDPISALYPRPRPTGIQDPGLGDDFYISQMVANSEIIDQQEAKIHENKRILREINWEIEKTQDEIKRIRRINIRIKVWNFIFSVISGILASILFHYLSEILNWN